MESTRDRLVKALYAEIYDDGGKCYVGPLETGNAVTVDGVFDLYGIIDAILSELEKPSDDVIEAGCTDPWNWLELKHTQARFAAMITAIREGK